jgi:hypothetical protein
LNNNLDEQFFDLCCSVLNYAIEFVESPGYASLRLVDVLKALIDLQFKMGGLKMSSFYHDVWEKLESRDLIADADERARLLDEMLSMFVDEWRKTSAE